MNRKAVRNSRSEKNEDFFQRKQLFNTKLLQFINPDILRVDFLIFVIIIVIYFVKRIKNEDYYDYRIIEGNKD